MSLFNIQYHQDVLWPVMETTKFFSKKSLPEHSLLKRRFDVDKDFVHNVQDVNVFRIRIKSHKGAAE